MATGDALQVRASQEPECDCSVNPDVTSAHLCQPREDSMTPYATAQKNSSQSSGGAPTPFGPAARR
jgi:hypothetical protein